MGHYGPHDRGVGGCECPECADFPPVPEVLWYDDLPDKFRHVLALLAEQSDIMSGAWEDVGGAAFATARGDRVLTVAPGPSYHHRDGGPVDRAAGKLADAGGVGA